MTVREALRRAASLLSAHGVPGARLDAEVLLAHVLGTERSGLFLDSGRRLRAGEERCYRALAERRARDRVPVAYLTGEREFWSRRVAVTRDVLIPRPESEGLVEVALELAARARVERILEVGVGSSAVAGAIAGELPRARLVALDRSRAALEIARSNLRGLGLLDRVALVRADLLGGLRGPFDLIVSNPPYVPTPELRSLPAEVRHEPTLALDGGPDGLAVLRRLVRQAPALLARPGHLALEVGAGQAGPVRELLAEAGARTLETRRDLSGLERVVLAGFGEA